MNVCHWNFNLLIRFTDKSHSESPSTRLPGKNVEMQPWEGLNRLYFDIECN